MSIYFCLKHVSTQLSFPKMKSLCWVILGFLFLSLCQKRVKGRKTNPFFLTLLIYCHSLRFLQCFSSIPHLCSISSPSFFPYYLEKCWSPKRRNKKLLTKVCRKEERFLNGGQQKKSCFEFCFWPFASTSLSFVLFLSIPSFPFSLQKTKRMTVNHSKTWPSLLAQFTGPVHWPSLLA